MTNKPPSPPQGEAAAERARMIETLMAQPIRARPSVVVFGDDAVVGFTPPAPPEEDIAPRR